VEGKKACWAGPCGERERERKAWLGWVGSRKERGKKKRGSGPGAIRKRGRKIIAFKCI
jgi:hypothetical protein